MLKRDNKVSKNGTTIIGICGGFQMLGDKIKDPYGIESNIKEIPGLGILELETIMEKEKILDNMKANFKIGYSFKWD